MDETEPVEAADRMDPTHRAKLALQCCETRHAPDSRVAVFDVTPAGRESNGDELVLRGSVSTSRHEREACEAVERATGRTTTSDLTVLESLRTEKTVARSVVPVRGDADDEGEQVTQVLYGARVAVFDRDGDWARVFTPDGYLGWVDVDALAEMEVEDANAVVARDTTTTEGETVYAGTPCKVEDDTETTAVFRTGERVASADGAIQRPPENPTGDDIVEITREYLGTEYDWGGMTSDGIDCSGLAWISYRVNGLVLPRDADQQRAMGESVERDDLRPGDLLFFPGHVAISLGGDEYVHAYGGAEAVVINSLDPESDSYIPDLDEKFELARRLI
ncbi:C40 family peptidase [Haladaptatus sp. T7]|uniref:NlpC/P60 family protein n=1 Tax=Haladaptatus sp. T7 TaxID=2029368 RepID=UPI0021A25534|nr:C40 family peptidase [Haladaptatus sp. T7]GKZ13040.1 peptidase [Haladaptatus sp. T7]